MMICGARKRNFTKIQSQMNLSLCHLTYPVGVVPVPVNKTEKSD